MLQEGWKGYAGVGNKVKPRNHSRGGTVISTTLAGISLELERKPIRNFYLRVLPPDGTVHLSAPKRAALAELARFVAKHAAWIEEKRAALAARPEPDVRRFLSGERCFLWGETLELTVKFGRRHNIVLRDGGRLILCLKAAEAESVAKEREAVLGEWYRRELLAAVPPVLARAETIVGQKAAEWRVKNMKTKWGTCNIRARRIWLNLQLAKYPPACLEYIIIHELTHLWERYHNAHFKSLMDEFCPDWRERKKLVNAPLA